MRLESRREGRRPGSISTSRRRWGRDPSPYGLLVADLRTRRRQEICSIQGPTRSVAAFGKPPIPHLHVAKVMRHIQKRMLDFRPDLRRAPLSRLQRHLPVNLPTLLFRAPGLAFVRGIAFLTRLGAVEEVQHARLSSLTMAQRGCVPIAEGGPVTPSQAER